MSLHELDLAERISDYVLCAENGTIGRTGTPQEVFEGDYIAKLYGIEHGSYLTSLDFRNSREQTERRGSLSSAAWGAGFLCTMP